MLPRQLPGLLPGQVQESAHPIAHSSPGVQSLFDAALKKLLEYEDTIRHLAALNRQLSDPVRIEHGIICPECKQKVAHTCPSPSPSSSVLPSSRLPLKNQPLSKMPTHFADSTTQDNLVGENCPTYSPRFPPTTSSSEIPSASTSYSINPYLRPPPYAQPPTSVALGNPAGFQTHINGPVAQEHLFSERMTMRTTTVAAIEPATFRNRPLPRIPSIVMSTSGSVDTSSPHKLRIPHRPTTVALYPDNLQLQSTGLTTPFGEGVAAHPASTATRPASWNRRLASGSWDISSIFPSHFTNPLPHLHRNPHRPTSITLYPDGLQTPHFTGPIAQENHLGKQCVTAYSPSIAIEHPIRRLPPSSHRPASVALYPAGFQSHSTGSTTQKNSLSERAPAIGPTFYNQRPPPRRSVLSSHSTNPVPLLRSPHSRSITLGNPDLRNVGNPFRTATSHLSTRSINSSLHPVLDDPLGFKTNSSRAISQEDFFGKHTDAHFASGATTSRKRQLPPIPTRLMSLSIDHNRCQNPYPPTNLPLLNIPSPSGVTSSTPLYSPSPQIAKGSSSNDSSWKRDTHLTDFRGGPVGNNSIQGSPEEKRNTNQQTEFHAPIATSSVHLFNDSFSVPSTTPSTPKTVTSPSVPPTLPRDRDVTPEQESAVDWSIRYNSEVKRSLDVTLIHTLHVGLGVVNCLKFSQDGKHLAVGFRLHGTTNIYDVQTGEKTCTLRDVINGKDIFSTTLCFSPNSMYLATGGTDDLVRIWEISKKHMRNVFKSSLGEPISCIDFSPDGRFIASGTFHFGSFHIWNWRDGSRKVFENLGTDINDIRFSPDGKHIAVGVFCGEVRMWNIRTCQLVEKLVGHRSWVYSVAFTPDGMGLVSGSHSEPTVKFWDISGLQSWDDGREAENSAGTKELLNFRGRKVCRFAH